MISRPRRTTFALGALAAAAWLSAPAAAGELVQAADHCAVYRGDLDGGNGTCGHPRLGEAGRSGDWHGASSSNAGLRSDGLGMLPGAGNARHLRIQADPDFR